MPFFSILTSKLCSTAMRMHSLRERNRAAALVVCAGVNELQNRDSTGRTQCKEVVYFVPARTPLGIRVSNEACRLKAILMLAVSVNPWFRCASVKAREGVMLSPGLLDRQATYNSPYAPKTVHRRLEKPGISGHRCGSGDKVCNHASADVYIHFVPVASRCSTT